MRAGRSTTVFVVLVSLPMLWWASTPQASLHPDSENRAIAPLWPQHWAYYTSDPDAHRTVVLNGQNSDGDWRFAALGRQRWWEFNLDRGAWLRFDALEALAQRVPASEWRSCNGGCPIDGLTRANVTDATTWVSCGPVTIGRVARTEGGAPTIDPGLRLADIALVNVRCA